MSPRDGGWIIALTILVAIVFHSMYFSGSAIPWIEYLRPQWVVIVVYFWATTCPTRIGVVGTWLVGFLVDVLNGEPLGLNGMLLAFVVTCCHVLSDWLRTRRITRLVATLAAVLVVVTSIRMIVNYIVLDVVTPPLVVVATILASVAFWGLLLPLLNPLGSRVVTS